MYTLLIITIILCQESRRTSVSTTDLSQIDSSCPCEKGEKGHAGVCPAGCSRRYDTFSRDCLNPRMNIERLARSIRQLIIDTKFVHRNARPVPCTCPSISLTSTVSNPYLLDYRTYTRLKGDKGDPGRSCSSNCMQSVQTNVRVFPTLKAAIDASDTYSDHTYVHIINEHGHLQGVFIRVHGQLVPLLLGGESTLPMQNQIVSVPDSKCTFTLHCQTLHIFALGPYTRKMCSSKRPILCSKLSDYDQLCARVSERHHLKGFYRAFISTNTQWLANLFDGICMNAKFNNMNEQTLFNSFKDIFEQKPPQSKILDVQGLKPQFQYWWHGSLPNGTASNDTCLDWSRQDSSLSGIASRLPDGIHGLFQYQYLWPCSLSDSNIGILCIETNCNERNSYKH